MSIQTLPPEAMKQSLVWRTNVIVALDGSEQRIALQLLPRQIFTLSYLADSNEEIQQWKYNFVRLLDALWKLPLWAESEKITEAVIIGATTVKADFTLMDNVLGYEFLILHPDGETYEVFPISGRTATTATRTTGTFVDAFPLGSVLIPVENCYTNNSSGYAPMIDNAATFTLGMVPDTFKLLEGKGAAAISTYNGRDLLDKRPLSDDAKEVFWQNQETIDFGGQLQIETSQGAANINSGRRYLSEGKADRQWWKSFLDARVGQQKSFYTSTYRHDMTVSTQPAVGGTTFKVLDDATVADGWESIESHLHLSVETADGTTQLKEIDPVLTVDNGDGTHTVAVTTAFTATVPGSTLDKVSFLELVRIGSDTVEIEHYHRNRVVTFPIRTIQA